MDIAHKIVTRLLLEGLWDEKGPVTAKRGEPLAEEDLTELLRAPSAQFVVADVGASLLWVPVKDCFSFWKDEVRPHLAEPGSRAVLDSFPGNYCYFASEWDTDGASKIVVLEKRH